MDLKETETGEKRNILVKEIINTIDMDTPTDIFTIYVDTLGGIAECLENSGDYKKVYQPIPCRSGKIHPPHRRCV